MKKLLCVIFGHKLIVTRNVTKVIVEVKCNRCKNEYAMHHEQKCMLELDEELRAANDFLHSYKKES